MLLSHVLMLMAERGMYFQTEIGIMQKLSYAAGLDVNYVKSFAPQSHDICDVLCH